MPKSGRTTTEEGYGWTHQQARAQLIRDLRDGDPCCRCGRPMFRNQTRFLDADHWRNHKPQPPDALAHRRCNRAAGAAAGNRTRTTRHHPHRTPRPPARHPDATTHPTPLPEW